MKNDIIPAGGLSIKVGYTAADKIIAEVEAKRKTEKLAKEKAAKVKADKKK